MIISSGGGLSESLRLNLTWGEIGWLEGDSKDMSNSKPGGRFDGDQNEPRR